MVDNRRGAVDLGTVLMVAAFAVIGGFLFWLNAQAAAERAAQEIVEETPEETVDTGIPTVAGADIQSDATPYEGQEIRLANFEVQSTLGTQGFWLGMPNGNPFLVSMSAEVMAEGIAVAQGNVATVVGVVHAMDAATLDAWTGAGTITDNDRIVAEFATHYLEATQVQIAGGGGAGGS